MAPLASSAKRTGLRVYAVDYYGDQDVRRSSIASLSVARQGGSYGNVLDEFHAEALLRLAERLCENHTVDVSILSSGFDDSFDTLSRLHRLVPILGNSPDLFRRVRERSSFFAELKRLGVDHPETEVAESHAEVKRIARDIGFPVLIKPVDGFGGAGIRKASDTQRLEEASTAVRRLSSRVAVQRYIPGMDVSVSVIAAPGRAQALAVSQQLLGVAQVGQQEPFGYCGNIVPLTESGSIIERCKVVAERVVAHFGLVGSNGVDMVISEEGRPYVVEVNPRFQGTMECVEQVLAMNLVQAHVSACRDGALPETPFKAEGFCIRLVLFAKRRSVVPDLSVFKECRDIPFAGAVIEKGAPICSVVVHGRNRGLVLRRAKEVSGSVYSSLSCL